MKTKVDEMSVALIKGAGGCRDQRPIEDRWPLRQQRPQIRAEMDHQPVVNFRGTVHVDGQILPQRASAPSAAIRYLLEEGIFSRIGRNDGSHIAVWWT